MTDDQTKKVSLLDMTKHGIVVGIIDIALLFVLGPIMGFGGNSQAAGLFGCALFLVLFFLGADWIFWRYLRRGNDAETSVSICTKLAAFFGIVAVVGVIIYLLVPALLNAMPSSVKDACALSDTSEICMQGNTCRLQGICPQTRTFLGVISMVLLAMAIQLAMTRELGKRVWK